jgi:hypothetical protein
MDHAPSNLDRKQMEEITWKEHIERDLKEMECEVVDCIQMVQTGWGPVAGSCERGNEFLD